MRRAREVNMRLGRFLLGFVWFPYQLALGVSVQILPCTGGRLLRVYFGPFKLWVNWAKEATDANRTNIT